ncbi:RNA helicase, putative [Plasmodium gallinaceum]|uniref:RNA helicase n=1 Tax=Plasmodium gallinaceum TaxID=5849 RepID=A0A1J1GXP3_PLAGA|nr:RNA helicase, putative [Plasmodium gallinaceum]CRG97228.1 RNA helicase, putative [Plasmodium gallinaceum]
MDVVKNLTYGLNLKSFLKNEDLMSLKEENLKPLRNILNLNKNNDPTENEKKKKISQSCESISFTKFYNNENLVNSYMKGNEINVEYVHINRNIVPIRFFSDIIEYLKIINKDRNIVVEEVDGINEKEDDDSSEKDKTDSIKKKSFLKKNKNKEKKLIKEEILLSTKEKNLKKDSNNLNIKKEEKEKKEKELINENIINKEYDKLLYTIKNTLCFKHPTSIQKICIPSILNGFNTICISQTGSGKTCAFLIPLLIKLNNLKNEKSNIILKNKQVNDDITFFIKSLIVVPTNELVTQIYEQTLIVFESYKKYSIVKLDKETEINENIDVCICTPLLLLILIKKKKVSLKKCFFIVFDEVDKLFEVKFLEHVNYLLKEIQNKKIQKIFTTATLPGKTKSFINTLCANYAIVYFGKNINTINNNLKQELLYVNSEDEKFLVLSNLIKNKEIHVPVLIFVDSITKAKEIYTNLSKSVSYIELFTSEKTKEERKKIFQKFQSGYIWYLICTDIMSRGIDIKGIETVINYDVCYDKYNYIHRIGRACRSDRKEGKAITFFTKENIKYMKDIVKFVKNSGTQIPAYLENFNFKKISKFKLSVKKNALKKKKVKDKKNFKVVNKKRKKIKEKFTKEKQDKELETTKV